MDVEFTLEAFSARQTPQDSLARFPRESMFAKHWEAVNESGV